MIQYPLATRAGSAVVTADPSPPGLHHAPEQLSEAECLQLISPGGVGRLVYYGRFGLSVLPVNYKLHQGTIVFRMTAPPTRISAPEYEAPSSRWPSRSTTSTPPRAKGGAF